jgi:glyoxylase-like metal-dependent hydrolase (beta-lactamase superfamily II)
MKYDVLKVGLMEANCYLVYSDSECLIIDPGDDADFIADYIFRKGLTPVQILATHGHFDHLMAAFELSTAFRIPFLICRKDEFLLDRMEDSVKHFIGKNIVTRKPVVSGDLNQKIRIKFGNEYFRIIETPGHTPGSISFYCAASKICISGDLLFPGGAVGRSDFKYADKQLLYKSIGQILKLPADTRILPGHGEETTVGTEKPYFI